MTSLWLRTCPPVETDSLQHGIPPFRKNREKMGHRRRAKPMSDGNFLSV
jgi:hypothetical protein